MVLALIIVLTLIVATGSVTLGGVDKQGPLAFAIPYATGRIAQEFHQLLAYGLAGLIVAHLLGVAYESVHDHGDIVRAMVTGDKAVRNGALESRPARARPILAAIAVALLLAFAARMVVSLSARPALGVPVGPLDPLYARECGACHMAYPPSLAPAQRWIAIMDDLLDHFGEIANLEPDIADPIRAYLAANAAETADTRAAHGFALADPGDPLRLTATPFWTRMHRKIPDSVFKSKAVGARSACDKCHSDASTGRFDPQAIHIPEQARP
jgi:Dihaem cytochrome c